MATTVITKGSIAISGAVSATGTTSATLYTCPASSYAIINVYCSISAFSAGSSLSVGGRTVWANTAGAGALPAGFGTNAGFTLYVGPSQAVTWATSDTGPQVRISGVQFTNT